MGSLDDPKLRDFHDQIEKAIYWSSKPDFQKICVILNGMSMQDMLDELWRIKVMGYLDNLARFVPTAQGDNNNRLRAAIGAQQDQPPSELDALVSKLPDDQQRAIKAVRAVTQAPDTLNPGLWPKYYWTTRLLPTRIPPPTPSKSVGGANPAAAGNPGKGQGGANDEDHLAADVATALTANAPKGSSPMTYTLTVVYRNLDLFTYPEDQEDDQGKKIEKPNEVSVFHEPNFSVQISPDPNNKAAYSAAVTLVNAHIKRYWGLIKPDIEASLAAQAGVQNPGAAPSAGMQTQVEVHVTSTVSVTAASSVAVGPRPGPGDPPDRGAFHRQSGPVDIAFTPFMIGILGHWDPPSK